MKSLPLLAGLLCAGLAQGQGAYRWVDDTGQIHYGDRPPPTASGRVEQRRLTAPAADRQLPFAVRQAALDYPVTLHVSADCGDLCQQAGDFLRKRGIPFAEKMAATPDEIAALAKLTGGPAQVPVLQVGKRALKGLEASAWNALLDAAGYPWAP